MSKEGMNVKKGTILIILGCVCFILALGLTIYNLHEMIRAKQISEDVVEKLIEKIPKQMTSKSESLPDYLKYPEKEMPSYLVNGERYIALLEIPEINLQLPVLGGEWSYKKLRQSPCRYSGSIYKDNIVLAAHNYISHFGRIKELQVGSSILLTDIKGNQFKYVVCAIEVLKPNQVEEMRNGDNWDLTMFTCTYNGKERFTLRCIRE